MKDNEYWDIKSVPPSSILAGSCTLFLTGFFATLWKTSRNKFVVKNSPSIADQLIQNQKGKTRNHYNHIKHSKFAAQALLYSFLLTGSSAYLGFYSFCRIKNINNVQDFSEFCSNLFNKVKPSTSLKEEDYGEEDFVLIESNLKT
jgi:hypothetical protein